VIIFLGRQYVESPGEKKVPNPAAQEPSASMKGTALKPEMKTDRLANRVDPTPPWLKIRSLKPQNTCFSPFFPPDFLSILKPGISLNKRGFQGGKLEVEKKSIGQVQDTLNTDFMKKGERRWESLHGR